MMNGPMRHSPRDSLARAIDSPDPTARSQSSVLARETLIAAYAPASFLLGPQYQILDRWGLVGQFHADGENATSIWDIIEESFRLSVRAALDRCAQTGSLVRFTGIPSGVGKSRSTITLVIRPLGAKSGESRFLATFESVPAETTDRDDAISREELVPYGYMTDHAADMKSVADENGRYIYLNYAYTRETGFSLQFEPELCVSDVNVSIRPEHFRELFASACGDAPHRYEARYRRKSGGTFPVEVAVMAVEHRGKRLLFSTARDITHRQQSRVETRETLRRYSLALTAGNMGAWEWDIAKNYVEWSPEMYRVFAIESGQFDGTFDDFEKHVLPEDRSSLRAAVNDAMNDGDDYDVACRIRRGDGEIRWIHGVGSVIRDDAGQPIRVVGVCWDSTKEKQSEQRLVEAQQAAEAASRAKSAFLTNVSHELRSPLTAILGFAEVLQEGERAPDRLEHLATIRRNGRYLLELLNDILDISKIEADRLEIRFVECDLARLLRDVVHLVSVRAQAKSLPLRLAAETPIPASILTDRIRLRQILLNLLSNAIKFTDAGEVILQAAVDKRAGRHRLLLRVIDTGIGVSQKQQKRLFQPFYQAHAEISEKYGGTGLGLSISRRLAEKLGGTIKIRSQRGVGSTFTVVLPLTSDEMARTIAPEQLSALERLQTPEAVHQRHLTIEGHVLIADDRRDIRRLATSLLRAAGAEISVAKDGLAAIRMVKRREQESRPIDLIVMDVQMPQLDGLSATRQLRQAGFTKPILALTANAMKDERIRCLDAGCNEYMTKPIDGKRLIHQIVDLLDRAAHADRDKLLKVQEHSHKKPNMSIGRSLQTSAPRALSDASAVSMKRRVLIVDDMTDAARSTAQLLGLRGHQVAYVGDGKSALEFVETFQPDVMIIDYNLPDMKGDQLVKQLQQSGKASIAFIGLSGLARDEFSDPTCLDCFDAFFTKPPDIPRMMEAITSHRRLR